MGLVITFWSVSALLCITPGADWAYAIASALKNKSPLPAVIGMLGGHLLAILVVAAGIGVLVAEVPWVLTALTVIGSLYLIWLGIGMFRNPPEVQSSKNVARDSVQRQLLKGLSVSGLNPKVFLLILVLLPQFVSAGQTIPVGFQMLIIGLLHLINTAVVYIGVGYSARRLLRTRPGAARIVSYLSGTAMILVGAGLLVGRVVG
ncbi:LysE family translocator [Corynebacterium sp. A21]|uniref:LysE family translocator n=1 Tax=Corynebacterium sp. A21 TaxID=3457318 RepID=UPI003FCF8AC7